MKKIFLFTLIIAAFSWQSCEKAEKIENFPYSKSKIVLNCKLLPDSSITAILYKSLSILDNAPNKVLKNAKVILYEDDKALMTLDAANMDNLYCFSSHKPMPGHTYRLEASLDGFESVTAVTSIPEAALIRDLNVAIYDTSSWSYNYGTPYNYYFMKGNVKAGIDDPVETENYYAVILYQLDTFYTFGEQGDTIRTDVYRNYFFYENSAQLNPLIEFNDGNYYYFSDQYFNGQKVTIEFPFSYGGEKKSWNLIVELVSLSKDEYLFKRTLQMFNQNGDDPFSEPVKMYTNVENGYGIFAGSSSSEKVVTVSM